MPRIISATEPNLGVQSTGLIRLDESFENESVRYRVEQFAIGHLYIPPELVLSDTLVTWIRTLDELRGWKIYADRHQFEQVGAPTIPQKS